MSPLQNLDIADFLAHYWQKKPLLIRQAFSNFESVISPEELAGLACEEDVFSRLLIEKHGAKPWQLVNGPFNEEDFLNLPETHYSLLVSECEKWLPELYQLTDQFNFIPQWRLDDLMISYAPEHGSVGPHLDQYDVFLLQAHGQRHWHIQSTDSLQPNLVADADVAILDNFESEQDWVLNPGDMLYLPPGVAHHGIALNPCMTYSIGFRAPSTQMLLEGLVAGLSKQHKLDDSARYTDPTLDLKRHPAQITSADIKQVENLIEQALQDRQQTLPNMTGKVMTQKALDKTLACNLDFDYDLNSIANKHPDALLAYHEQAESVLFFYNGESIEAEKDCLASIQFLCEQREFALQQIPNIHQPNVLALVDHLIHQSILLTEGYDD